MSSHHHHHGHDHGHHHDHDDAGDDSQCLARSVASALAEAPLLEAVTIDRVSDSLSVATLGKKDSSALEAKATAAVQHGREVSAQHECGLLTGRGDCATCDIPLTDKERQALIITQEPQKTTIARPTCPTAPRFWHWHKLALPRFVPKEIEIHDDHDHGDEWKLQLLAAGLCAGFGLAGHFLGEGWPSLACFIAAYVAGAWFAVGETWELLRNATLDVHFLMLAVAAGAASIGGWREGTTLLFLFSLSGALEHYAMGRTQREIKSLFREAPKSATVLDAGHEREVAVDKLTIGMRLLVKPGAQFPVDAEVVKGATAADESNLTGEATPVEKKIGDTLLAGTMNLWGAVEAVVLRPAAESSLQKIIRLIRDAQRLKAPSQRFTDKFGSGYTYAILGLSLVMFFVWWLGFGMPAFADQAAAHSAFYRAMILLVVASPCALVLSIPSAILAAIAWGARHGVLFRGGAAVEKLAEVDVVALDKTGTLTTGELKVEKVESFPPGREHDVAQLAFSMDRLSTHPLARAITRHGKQQNLAPLALDHFESITGQGLCARLDGQECWLGRRELVANGEPTTPASEPGVSEVWVRHGELLGRLLLRDDIRPRAATVLDELRRAGLQSVVLTGDRQATADFLKAKLHVDDVRAELKPEQKVAAIQSFTNQGRRVAMVGDGVNDAPSLAAAHVGVAMGARGSDAALEQAEVVLMHDRLENFLAAFRLSQAARRVIHQNLFISLGTVVVLVAFALSGKIPLTLGVLGHEGSTVVVVLNSLRLLFVRSEKS
ncbi:MAG: cadmium-translocating P-type ATPase [Verrucomicrobia bacterium]|nr:cadmium-translocating P-type ATPase [Verrucomicrobiota bacterium]